MKKLLLIFYFILLTFLSQSQGPQFQWAKSMGGTYDDIGYSIATDVWGNVYTTGYFRDTVDFDPGVGTFYLSAAVNINSPDIFISKLDASGNFVWAKRMGGIQYDFGGAIAVDGLGNVYTTGHFRGTVDFDPGPGTFNLTAANYQDVFISKLNASGTFVWAKSIGGTLTDQGWSIAIDTSGNIYTAGIFSGIADFDPGPGTYSLTSVGGYDLFLSKLDSSGNFVWAKSMGGPLDDFASSIAFDASGNVYFTGEFEGTCDFDPGAGIVNLVAIGFSDIFISKLDASGNFVWVKSMGGTNYDLGSSIALDASGNVYTTGVFSEQADFDPGIGTFYLSPGITAYFISKLDPSGNFVWAKNIRGLPSYFGIPNIKLDASANVYLAGGFVLTSDFDPGAGTFSLTSTGGSDFFVLKLNSSGNFLWAKNMGGASDDVGNSIAVDVWGNIYTTGYFQGTVDFDPGPGTSTLTSVADVDIFIHKMSQCSPKINVISTTTLLCAGNSATLTANGANNYLWNTGSTSASIAVSPTITTTYTVNGINPDSCSNSQKININVNICTEISNAISLGIAGLKIYPNPSYGILNIETEATNKEIIIIQLINTMGQIVLDEKLNTNQCAYDISHLNNGIYNVLLKQNGGIRTLKIVKE